MASGQEEAQGHLSDLLKVLKRRGPSGCQGVMKSKSPGPAEAVSGCWLSCFVSCVCLGRSVERAFSVCDVLGGWKC